MMLESGHFTVIVVGRTIEASDVISLEVALAHGGPLPLWSAGAHIDVAVDGGDFRQYSLCGSAEDPSRWRIGVLLERQSRGGSIFLHDRVQLGSQLVVSLPRNNFPLLASESYIFIAGGIGITPILPMIAAAQHAHADWMLYYGGRSRDSMAFAGELQDYGSRVEIIPADLMGLLPLESILANNTESDVYCCGPEPLLGAVAALHSGAGTLHLERFKPRAYQPLVDGRVGFEVQIASSGSRITVGADQTIVDALATTGIDVTTSCLEGTCASCETGVLSGDVMHLDSVLSEDERERGDSMMLCVSRARSGLLVLDL